MKLRTRGVGLALLILLGLPPAAAVESPLLRHTNYVAFIAKAGSPVKIHLRCESHSSRYQDILKYSVIGRRSEVALEGQVMLGREKVVGFTPAQDGLHVVVVDSGWNRAVIDIEGAPWAIVVSERCKLQTVRELGPLYFYVPRGVKKFKVLVSASVTGEAARVKVCRPDGKAVIDKPDDFDKVTALKVTVPQGADGKAWSLAFLKPASLGLGIDDVETYFDAAIPPYLCVKAEWAGLFGQRPQARK